MTENKHRFLETGNQSSNRRQQVRHAEATRSLPRSHTQGNVGTPAGLAVREAAAAPACLRSNLLSCSCTIIKHLMGCAVSVPEMIFCQTAASHRRCRGVPVPCCSGNGCLEGLFDLGAAGDPRPVQRVCARAHRCKPYSSCSPRATLPCQADTVWAAPPHALLAERQAVPDPQHREQESGHPGELLATGCISANMVTSACCRAVPLRKRGGTSMVHHNAARAAGASLRKFKPLSSHLSRAGDEHCLCSLIMAAHNLPQLPQ